MVMGTLFAQNEMAILNHNGNLQAFYGTSALNVAIDSAVAGDVITVSSGTFPIYSIKSGITVNGNGFEEDLVAGGIMPTILTYAGSGYSTYIAINDSAVVSGLKFNHQTRVFGSNVQISKCYFYDLVNGGSDHTTLVNCFFDRLSNCGSDWVITNSIVAIFASGGTRLQVHNSLVYTNTWYSITNGSYGTFYNSVIMVNTGNLAQTGCYNCVGINTSGNTPDLFTGAINHLQFQNMSQTQQDSVLAVADQSHGNYNASNYAEVFKTFRADYYTERLDFSLTTAFDTLMTDLGVYKGMMPYTPFVNRPRYVRTNAASRTTLDGKLSVDIEVVTAEE